MGNSVADPYRLKNQNNKIKYTIGSGAGKKETSEMWKTKQVQKGKALFNNI